MGLDDWLWLRAAVTHAFRAGASELSISPLSIAASAIGMAIVRSSDVRSLGGVPAEGHGHWPPRTGSGLAAAS